MGLPCSHYLLWRGSLEPGWKAGLALVCSWKDISVVSHLFGFFIRFTDTDGTVTLTTLPSASPLLPRSRLIVYLPCNSGLTTCGNFADTLMERKLVVDRFHQSIPGAAYVTSQRKQTLTIIGIQWQSNMFTGRSKADTLWTSNKQASKEQLKNTSKQLLMKFMLQLHKLPKWLEPKCGKWVLSKIKQSKLGRLMIEWDE